MRSKLRFTLTLSAALAPALAGSALAAPDQTLGVALMGATVSLQGNIYPQLSSGVASAKRIAVGYYEVKFNRSLFGCTPAVSPLLSSSIVEFNGLDDGDGDETLMRVRTYDPTGTPADSGFTVVYFCGR